MSNMNLGLVFNLVHGSFVDGWGIRTTIFLKGCPLKCVWCCNPEGQSRAPELKLAADRCSACGLCLDRCPRGALSLRGGTVRVDRLLCDGCGKCSDYCCTGALDVFGKWYSPEELYDVVRRDKRYYDSSGGGVTVGGGEPTMQADFLLDFMRLCHEGGIHVALDSCGYTTSEKGLEALRSADLILMDLKGLDSEQHQKYTGLENRVILDNIRMLSDMRKPMIFRIPVIPGYTRERGTLLAEAELLSALSSVERVDILPVHQFGRVKYQQLDKPYLYAGEPLSNEELDDILAIFSGRGLRAQIGG